MRSLAAVVALALLTAACAAPAPQTPEPAARSVTAACGGGVTGGASGVTLHADGALYRWQRTRPAPAPADSTLVRTDTALAADVFRRLEQMDFMAIEYSNPGNMTCWLSVRTDSAAHRVAWSGDDPKVPSGVREVFERLRSGVGERP